MEVELYRSAALDLRYWLEIQRPDALFHPSGRDVRDTPAYQRIAQLLDQGLGEPNIVHGASLSVEGECGNRILPACEAPPVVGSAAAATTASREQQEAA